MKIVIPTFIFNEKDIKNQMKLTLTLIHSYYSYSGNNLPITIVTNSEYLKEKIEVSYINKTNYDITVDLVSLNKIKKTSPTLEKFHLKNVMNGETHKNHNPLIYSIKYYMLLHYNDVIMLDNDMLFMEGVNFEVICKNSEKFIDFSQYDTEKHGDWNTYRYTSEKKKHLVKINSYGGCIYIPMKNNMKFILKDLIKDKEFLPEQGSTTLTAEFIQLMMYIKYDNIINYNSKINVYNFYGYDDVKLLHFQLKPYNLIINKDKTTYIKSMKPITEFNNETLKFTIVTEKMLINILKWYKHLAQVNEIMDYYFDDLFFDTNFFNGLIKAFTKKP